MSFFTHIYGRNRVSFPILVLWLTLIASGFLQAQISTNTDVTNLPPSNLSITNGVPALPDDTLHTAPTPVEPASSLNLPATPPPRAIDDELPTPEVIHRDEDAPFPDWKILAALMTFLSVGGFLLYQGGLTQAKNCGHSATLLLVGVVFGLIGYWMGGFAVQTGGIGDSHAALAQSIPAAGRNALDHELGFTTFGHHWGIMGSSGFFLITDETASNGSPALFLTQAALLALVLAATLGTSLERVRLVAMAVFAFLVGVFIYPLLANWVWGGGWLAELGREYGLGHGYVDLAGAGVVHETAGTLALVIAIVLGPRTGRFGKNPKAILGHNMPFVLFGTILLLVSWIATNAFANEDSTAQSTPAAGLAAMNTLLAAAAGLLASFLLAAWQKRRPTPALLSRGVLSGAVASCGCSALIDPWAAFVIGGLAGIFVEGTTAFLENRRIDDPVSAAATHGVCGAWGVLATGLFANGLAGHGLNGVDGPVRGLFYGGALHQLIAQIIGAITGFVVVFILGYACLILVQKILGLRVTVAEEAEGLDWSQTGALGYQADAEPDSKS
jgi:Amt family ammonium transporter